MDLLSDKVLIIHKIQGRINEEMANKNDLYEIH